MGAAEQRPCQTCVLWEICGDRDPAATLERNRVKLDNSDDVRRLDKLPYGEAAKVALGEARPERCADLTVLVMSMVEISDIRGHQWAKCPEIALAGLIMGDDFPDPDFDV